jgi:Short C-terminal domain
MIHVSAEAFWRSRPMDDQQRKEFNEASSRQIAIHLIRELAELHKDGILTDEEFNAKKQEMLSRL